MNALQYKRGRGLSRGLLTATIFLSLFVVGGLAAGDDFPGRDGAAPGGGSSGGIGTVPDEGGSPGLPLPNASGFSSGLMTPPKPALRLVGSLDDLEAVVSRTYSIDGTGWFRKQTVQGQVSYEFFGNVVVELDRVAFANGAVSAQLSVAPNFAGGIASLATPRGRSAVQALSTGNLNLKLHRTVQSGLADAGLELLMRSKQGAKATLQFSSDADLIRLEQGH